MSTPLDGVLVADFSRVLAGPLATMTLADLGARVIKVEHPAGGDDTRRWGPPWVGGDPAGGSTYFASVNRSKESVTLDLTDPEDLALARELARRADVVIHNFKTGTAEKLGIGYDAVAADNPGIVYCEVTGFGSGSPLLGYDFVVQAVGGLMSITGEPGSPMKAGVALVDVLTAKDATIGILAALVARGRTGRGDRIEVSLLASSLGAMANQGQAALETGVAPGAMGNRHPSIVPYETLPARDGVFVVACGNDGQFARLAQVVGLPSLAGDSRFATNAARVDHRDELVALLSETLLTDDAATWVARLTEADVPAGRVNDLLAAVELAEQVGLEPTVEIKGNTRQLRHPIVWAEHRVSSPTPPPTLGQHNEAVRVWLGSELSDAQP